MQAVDHADLEPQPAEHRLRVGDELFALHPSRYVQGVESVSGKMTPYCPRVYWMLIVETDGEMLMYHSFILNHHNKVEARKLGRWVPIDAVMRELNDGHLILERPTV